MISLRSPSERPDEVFPSYSVSSCLLRLPHTFPRTLPACVLHRHPFPFHVTTFALALLCTNMHGSIPSIMHHGLLRLSSDPRCKLSNHIQEGLHAFLHISLCLVHNILLKLTAHTYFSAIRTRIFYGSISGFSSKQKAQS